MIQMIFPSEIIQAREKETIFQTVKTGLSTEKFTVAKPSLINGVEIETF